MNSSKPHAVSVFLPAIEEQQARLRLNGQHKLCLKPTKKRKLSQNLCPNITFLKHGVMKALNT